MFGKRKWIGASLLGVALLVLGIGGSIVLAQGPTPTPAKSWGDLYKQILAQKLGIPVDKLQQATTEARQDALSQAVKQGLLTQKQADALSQRLKNAGVRSGAMSFVTAGQEAAAKALGMSTADLMTAQRGGKTLLDLAREKNVDATKLRTAIADAEKAAIDQAVKDGKITQAQADMLKANIKPENIDLNRKSFGPPFTNQLKQQVIQRFKDRFNKPGGGPFPTLPFKR